MGKIVYITEDKLDNLHNHVTFYRFKSNVVAYLRNLLKNPATTEFNDFFKENNITKKSLLNRMLKKGILEKKEKIKEVDGESVMIIQYKVPRSDFKKKIKRLYSYYFENNNGKSLNETDCAGVGAMGNGFDSSGQYDIKIGGRGTKKKPSVISRDIYNVSPNI